MRDHPSLERVKAIFSYNAETGEFRHLVARKGVRVGTVAGSMSSSDGLRYIGIDSKRIAAQRLAWFYVTGEWPAHEVGFLDGSLASPMRERFDNLAMTVVGKLTAVEVRQIFNYDPETGYLTYRTPRRGVKVGSRAGSVDTNGYRYIGVRGDYHTAQRLAWLHYHGEWPDGSVRFKNDNRDDCSINNLHVPLGVSDPVLRRAYDKADRKAKPDKYRNSDMKRSFGIDLAEYQRMFVEQAGVCAICKQAETATRGGKAKWMAVDHDHTTGAVRGLLCNRCNVAVGMLNDDPARLRSAADYLEAHARPDNVVPLKKDTA